MAKRTLNLDTKDIELILEALDSQKSSPRMISLLRKMKNNLKTIKISSRKGKGRSLQKFICREIGELIGIPYDQEDDQCLIHSREMGQAGLDVILRGRAQKLFPYCIETKASESLSLTEAIQQAQNNTVEPYDWMVIHKRKILNEPIVMISWYAFKKVFSKKL
jgi:hypothetical protein